MFLQCMVSFAEEEESSDTGVGGVAVPDGPELVKIPLQVEPRRPRRSAQSKQKTKTKAPAQMLHVSVIAPQTPGEGGTQARNFHFAALPTVPSLRTSAASGTPHSYKTAAERGDS